MDANLGTHLMKNRDFPLPGLTVPPTNYPPTTKGTVVMLQQSILGQPSDPSAHLPKQREPMAGVTPTDAPEGGSMS